MSDITTSNTILKFPVDEGLHRGAIHEWWYFNGHVTGNNGYSYGLMVCFFKYGQLFVAVTDEYNKKFYGKIIYDKFIGAQNKLSVSIGKNWWIENQKFRYQLHIEFPEINLDLNMISERPPLLIGGGEVPMGKGGLSKYYSQTRLKLMGNLELSGNKIDIRGIGWIDRQWGNWDFNGFNGWEWFSIQLKDGPDIGIFNILDPYTNEPITPMLNFMNPDGKQETLDKYEIEYLDYWLHPETGEKFSHGWKIKIPQKNIELTVTPTLDNQTLDQNLWEGSCKVTGKIGEEKVKGMAYAELFLGRNENLTVKTVKLIASLSRVWEWWDKIQVVIAASLILLFAHTYTVDDFPLLAIIGIYMVFLGSYGYAINAFADIESDKKAGKHHEIHFAPAKYVYPIIFIFALGAITIPFLFGKINIIILGIILFILISFYSVKPVRFKERGFFGIIVATITQRTLPFLFFMLLIGQYSILAWYLLVWVTMTGIVMELSHQLLDFKNDKNSQVETWAQRVGVDFTRNITMISIVVMIVYMLFAPFIFEFQTGISIMVVLFAFSYFPIFYASRSLKQTRKEVMMYFKN